MLSILGSVYAKIANLRNFLYDRGALRSYSLGAKTISVGNITTGGTGKTPLVAFTANVLAERGEKVCILTRGYGRRNPNRRVLVSDGTNLLTDPRTTGDEPLELARQLRGKAVIVADADRVAAAKWAREEFGITAFILDDGFQHRRAKRDLDIVCIDADNPFGNKKMLPAGILREPLENLQRSDAIVLTRADLADDIKSLRQQIAALTTAPIFECRTRIDQIISLQDFQSGNVTRGHSISKRMFSFCGLGNPADFFRIVGERFNLVGSKPFRDHHVYSQTDIETIEREAVAAGAEVLITTGKDAVKLNQADFSLPCFVMSVRMEINEAAFQKIL